MNGSVQILILEIVADRKVRTLHRNLEYIPQGMTVKKAVRMLLAKAAENFQDPAPAHGRD